MNHRPQQHSGKAGLVKLLRLVATAIFAAGIVFLIKGGTLSQTASASHAAPNPSVTPPGLAGEQQWGRWHAADKNKSFPTTKASFVMGQTVSIPGYVSISVDSVDRNWQPQPWQISPSSAGAQDDATGKEIILVHFTLTNLSSEPIDWADHYFSLVRANGHEQRVAALAELTADQYGCFGQASPWLFPGATAHTFVPFLVRPGEPPMSFIFYWERMDLGTPSTNTSTNPKGNVPTYIGVARVPFALNAPPATANNSVVFSPDTNFTVTSTDIYSS